MKPTLHITRGLPASGKTTWAKSWVAEDPTSRARVNRDDLRAMLHDGVWKGHPTEKQVIAARDKVIAALLRQGVSVVCDDTNLPVRTCHELIRVANENRADWKIHDHFAQVPLETCLQRDWARAKPVGDHVIREMLRFFRNGWLEAVQVKEPLEQEQYVPPEGKPRAILVDLDGTLALHNGRDPYDESKVAQDLLNEPVAAVVRAMAAAGHEVVFMSGRTTGCRDASSYWLAKHFAGQSWVGKANLFMRASGDSRKDSVVKRELFDKFVRENWNVVAVLDDRDQVVKMWRSLGLTCLQVAPGDF